MSVYRRFLSVALLWLGLGSLQAMAEELSAEVSLESQSLSMPEVGSALGHGFERQEVLQGIAHYTTRVQVGPGAYDVITLHRVVRESSPGRPAPSPRSVFMIHGDAWNFTGAFMASTLSTAVPADHSIALYLAQQGVDVWGIDLRWTHVPMATQDFDFMKGWNMGTHVQDVGQGLELARSVRIRTGSGGGRMYLLGWSRGALLGYAYLSAETQRPSNLHHVAGFIPVDMVLKFGPEAAQQKAWACERLAVALQAQQAGRAEGGLLGPGAGVGVKFMGDLATAAPDAPTPLLPLPLTNRQVALLGGAATFSLFSPLQAAVPGYHFTAGQFSAQGLPTALSHVPEAFLFNYLSQANPYQDFNEVVEGELLMCDSKSLPGVPSLPDLPYDDHLAQVKVPVLYVGAAGGFGQFGVHSTTLLGSTHVTVHMVQNLPAEARVLDYGHADLFLASDARERVWAPILAWMKHHY
jgi:hypothetical protein